MLKEFQFQRSKQKMFAMDEGWHVFKEWECRSAFVPGKNALGQPRETLPNGNYYNVVAEITSIYGASLAHFTSVPGISGRVIFTVAALALWIHGLNGKDGFQHMAACGCKMKMVKNLPA